MSRALVVPEREKGVQIGGELTYLTPVGPDEITDGRFRLIVAAKHGRPIAATIERIDGDHATRAGGGGSWASPSIRAARRWNSSRRHPAS